MKISLEWLQEYIDIPESPVQLKEDLTMAGSVVESVSQAGTNMVFEFEITSNRPDCLSHIGIAREIAALYKRPMKAPPRRRKLDILVQKLPYSVEIRDADLCPRYVGLVLSGVRVGPSPEWMQRRLEDAGMRPVNNIVDITNYVLLEMGHPLHAFDFKLLRQGKIIVARASEGQKIATLDGIERLLDQEMLLINDGEGPVAIAGVMGGQNSEISGDTDTVLLECAYFKPESIRRTSRKLGLSTEASFRFERGADWDLTVPAIARTCYLIEKLAGGKIAGSLQDVYPAPVEQVRIELSRRRAETLLGVALSREFIESTLRSLNFRMSRRGRDTWLVTCPTYRADMELEADLIEELARFHGYQNIPTTIPPSKSAGLPSPVFAFENATRRLLLGLGYCEAVNLSFAGESEHRDFQPQVGDRVSILNPLTEDTRYMRTTLAAGLVKAIRHNFNYDNKQVRLFEIGRVYLKGLDSHPLERNTLAIAATGAFTGSNWVHPDEAYSFFHLKGIVSAVLEGIHCTRFTFKAGAEAAWLDPANASTLVVADQRVGILGSLHPGLQESFKMRQPVFLAELDFDQLRRHMFQAVRYEPLPRYPAVERDLSIVVPGDVPYGDICRGIEALGLPELCRIDLVDVYDGQKIPAGKISLTLRFTFVDRDKTLTVDRVQGFSDNIIAFLKNSWDAELR
jgi:phenylalanyl-tRNA synthetase beta chain